MKPLPFSILIIALLSACTKDKVQEPCINCEPTNKWEYVSGNYTVYDTSMNYMYDMNISYFYNDVNKTNNLSFNNLDDNFSLSTIQPDQSSNPEFYISIGSHNLVYDSNGNRWRILISIDSVYNNQVIDDTLRLRFRKTNISYYLEDFVTFVDTVVRQIAIKQ